MEKRRPFISGNWKMHKTGPEAVEAASALAGLVAGVSDVDVMIAPTFTALAPVADALKGTNISLGGQDLFWESQGAYTGQISGEMLTAAGCDHVIIGHSERRQYFGETDETVNRKIRAAIGVGLAPVMCVGETEEERESKKTYSVLDKQIKDGLIDFVSGDLEKLIVAYEPVWAIGTGKTATTEQAQEAHQFLRSLLQKLFGDVVAESTRILYGGSVKPGNVSELMAMPDIDGGLVGGASLDPETFSKIVKF
ncbi:MAG: triose-phosphate isomerase [Desulfobacterales bacterium]|nr:triose-phosphate isomerase [Desulfobacterales bacterium]